MNRQAPLSASRSQSGLVHDPALLLRDGTPTESDRHEFVIFDQTL